MLFQFAAYPALVRTIGIIRLLRGSGMFCALLFLALPDVQRLASSENASYVLGVAAVVLVGSCTSVVRSLFPAMLYLMTEPRSSSKWIHPCVKTL